MPDKIGNNSLF